MFYLGAQTNEPAFQPLESVAVDDVVEIRRETLAKGGYRELFSWPTEEILSRLSQVFEWSHGIANFIKISKLSGTDTAGDLPVPSFPKTTVIHTDRLATWLKSHESAVVVDLRSVQEQSSSPLAYKGTIASVPYSVKGGSRKFRWDRRVMDIESDSLDIARLESLGSSVDNRYLLLVGAAPFDGRPPWALFALLGTRVQNLAWFYDGADKFNEVVK